MKRLRRDSSKSGWILFLMIVSGMIVGGYLGELLGKFLPILKFGYPIGISDHTWNLAIIKLTFGFGININMFGILGILLAIYFYWRM